jgi:nucleotide-binding universal stress UspA family protein
MSGIIAATDGSAHSQHAVDWAAREAALRRVPLTVLTVYQGPAGYWGGKPGHHGEGSPRDRARALAQEQADKAVSQLAGISPPSVEIRAVFGIPADEIIRAADDAGAGMIVVASRGTGGFARLRLGSVTTRLTHHAHHPVVVIRAENGRR